MGAIAGEHRHERFGVNGALQAQLGGGVSEPVADGLALAAVVVLGAFGDLVEVVALLAASQLPDRQHHLSLSGESFSLPRSLNEVMRCEGLLQFAVCRCLGR